MIFYLPDKFIYFFSASPKLRTELGNIVSGTEHGALTASGIKTCESVQICGMTVKNSVEV